MEAIFVIVAFLFGFAVRQVGLPPLVGFLCAGFFLNLLGIESTEIIRQLADIGILLMLFSIGLKVRLSKLLVPQIWGTAGLHMMTITLFFGLILFIAGLLGIPYLTGLSFSTYLILAFALSFSSTVFAVKILEEKGEMTSKHGRIAIGILIMQDLFAVIFITLSSGTLPSPWALALFLLPLLRKPLVAIMDRSGHGELLVLLACILPLAGAYLFELVGLKPDLGALVFGVMFAGHTKTDELAKAMFGFKDLFLVGFFLTIGMSEFPVFPMIPTAFFLVLLVLAKAALFYVLLTRLQLRARTSLYTTMTLANYSEFGLIVGAVGVSSGWLGSEWLGIIAVALSISMIALSIFSPLVPIWYVKFKPFLKSFETDERLPEDREIDIGEATVAVFGVGRIGTAAYDQLRERYGKDVIGIDFDEVRVARHQARGRQVIQGDASDDDFWRRGFAGDKRFNLVLLAMGHASNIKAVKKIKILSSNEIVGAICEYDDQKPELEKAGVDYVFNAYAEAGVGFSDHVCGLIKARGIRV
ncbi:cation:proton antiporter family protein [Desulfopila sp. IMCC35008]|uniref:cation:proton antiporter family protein n=1 Tax=Desulfopila sp. IMCC35008 TaxID=2653858 RepID=UPI0013D57602|nr:cation:proton antiporter family protein [Desulfopila sp. IMCC35008]